MVKVEVKDYRLLLDGNEIAKQGPEGEVPRFIGISSQFNAFVKLTTKYAMPVGRHVVTLNISASYDTLPPSGKRQSYMKVKYEVSVTNQGSSIDTQTIVEQIEN